MDTNQRSFARISVLFLTHSTIFSAASCASSAVNGDNAEDKSSGYPAAPDKSG